MIKKRIHKKMTRALLTSAFVWCCVGGGFGEIKPTGGFDAPYFQADYIQDLSEFSAALINPALIYRVNQFRLEAGFYRWGGVNPFGEELGYQQSSFLAPIRLRHTLGLSVISSGSEFIKAQLNPTTFEPEETGTGEFFEVWFIPHYSFRVLPWLSLGVNPKLVMQNQFNNYSYGFGMDFGIYANAFDHYRFGDLGVSINFQDIIPANLKWKSDDGETPNQLMTTRFRGGLRYAVLNDKLILDFEIIGDNLFQDMWDFLIDISEKGDSVEVVDPVTGDTTKVWQEDNLEGYLDKIGRVSAHVKFQWIPQVWFKFGWANNNVPYIGFNFNVIYLWPEMINYASLDVHFGYSLNEFERGATGMIKLSTDFGPTREQRESKRLYERLVLAPMNAYNEAMRLYVAKKYWEAGFAFGKVLALFPNFHLNDKATYYMGDCYTQLRLHGIARQVFKEGLAEYSTSDMRAKYLYGLQLLDYREGKYKDALKNHAFISNLYGQSEIKPDADYLAGEIHFLRKNYSAAAQVLSGIPPGTSVYNYAQYTLSIVNVENNKIKAAIQNLTDIVSDTAADEAGQLLRHAGDIKLGQLYFEQVELRKAVEAFKRVPPHSDQGDEALIGIAWSWIKVNRPQECLRAVQQLISAHPKSPLKPEAYLVEGYALMLMQRNQEAIEAINECLSLCKTEFANEDDLSFKKEKFQQTEVDFIPTANQIKKNALRKPTDKIIAERSSLKTKFETFDKESRDVFYYTLMVKDNKKFFRRKEQVIMDAEYALAKLSKIIGTSKEKEIIEKDMKKQEKLDDEIDKLEKELEGIDEE